MEKPPPHLVGDPDPKSNNAGLGSNAKKQPHEHYQFVNEVAVRTELALAQGFSDGNVARDTMR